MAAGYLRRLDAPLRRRASEKAQVRSQWLRPSARLRRVYRRRRIALVVCAVVAACLVATRVALYLTSLHGPHGTLVDVEVELLSSSTSSFYFEPVLSYTPHETLQLLARAPSEVPSLEVLEEALSLPRLLAWAFGTPAERRVVASNTSSHMVVQYYRCKWLLGLRQHVLGVQSETDPIQGDSGGCAEALKASGAPAWLTSKLYSGTSTLVGHSPDGSGGGASAAAAPTPGQPRGERPLLTDRQRHRKTTLYNATLQLDTPGLLDLDRLAFNDEDVAPLDGFQFCPYLNRSLFFQHWNVSAPTTSSLFVSLPPSLLEGFSAPRSRPWAQRKLYFGVKSNAPLVVQLIDHEAKNIYDLFWEKVSGARTAFQDREEPIKRFACLMAALGNNAFSSIVDTPVQFARAHGGHAGPLGESSASAAHGAPALPRRLLASLHPDVFFPNVGFSTGAGLYGPTAGALGAAPTSAAATLAKKADEAAAANNADVSLRTSGGGVIHASSGHTADAQPPRKHYRLAYLLMVHAKAANTLELIDAVHDEDSFILIHVDYRSPLFKEQLRAELVRRFPHATRAGAHVDNIQIMDVSYDVLWGHVSMVWAELRGFFELLDRCSFDFVVNLSGHDYPMTSNAQISRLLRPFERLPVVDADGFETELGVNFVFDVDSRQAVERIAYPIFITHDPDSETGTYASCWWFARDLAADLDQEFPVVRKTSQWMILHRSLVNYMRKDYRTRLLLAYLEHSMVPDESFFATYVLSTPLFADNQLPHRRSNNPKRLIYWGGEDWRHPKLMDLREDEPILQEDAFAEGSWFMRKVDVHRTPDLRQRLDAQRNESVGWEHFLPPGMLRRYATMLGQLARSKDMTADTDPATGRSSETRYDESIPAFGSRTQSSVRRLVHVRGDSATAFNLPETAAAAFQAGGGPEAVLEEVPQPAFKPVPVATRRRWNYQRLQYIENHLQISAYIVDSFLRRQIHRKFTSLVVPVRPS